MYLPNIREVFEKPETAKGKSSGFAMKEEIGSTKKRHEQLTQGSAENHDGVAEPTEEKMPALVNDQINVIEKEKTAAVERRIEEEESVEAEPADSRETGDRLPSAEAILEKRHKLQRNKSSFRSKEFRAWLLPKTSCRRCLPAR
jgi:hypothetical protein